MKVTLEYPLILMENLKLQFEIQINDLTWCQEVAQDLGVANPRKEDSLRRKKRKRRLCFMVPSMLSCYLYLLPCVWLQWQQPSVQSHFILQQHNTCELKRSLTIILLNIKKIFVCSVKNYIICARNTYWNLKNLYLFSLTQSRSIFGFVIEIRFLIFLKPEKHMLFTVFY